MFTVKVVRRGSDGSETVSFYRARHVATHWNPENPTMRGVSWIEADSGENPGVKVGEQEVTVGSKLPIEHDEMRVVEVFVENEHGQTTEVIR